MPGRGTQMHSFRLSEPTWNRFGEAVKAAGTTRTDVLRAFVRWYLRYPGAELPERPNEADRP
jgi:hypothetical protein